MADSHPMALQAKSNLSHVSSPCQTEIEEESLDQQSMEHQSQKTPESPRTSYHQEGTPSNNIESSMSDSQCSIIPCGQRTPQCNSQHSYSEYESSQTQTRVKNFYREVPLRL